MRPTPLKRIGSGNNGTRRQIQTPGDLMIEPPSLGVNSSRGSHGNRPPFEAFDGYSQATGLCGESSVVGTDDGFGNVDADSLVGDFEEAAAKSKYDQGTSPQAYTIPSPPILTDKPPPKSSGRLPRIFDSSESRALNRAAGADSADAGSSIGGGDSLDGGVTVTLSGAAVPTALKMGDVTQLLSQVEADLAIVEGNLARVTNAEESLLSREAQVKMEVEQRFNRMIAGLQERKKQVMRNISTNTAPRHQELLSQQSRLRETARAMRSGCDMTRQTLEQSEDVEVLWNITGQVEEDHIRVISGNSSTAVKSIIYGLKEFQEQDLSLEEFNETPLFFVPTHDNLETHVSHFGRITNDVTLPSKSFARGPGLREAEQGVSSGFLVFAKDHGGNARMGGGDVVSIEILKYTDNAAAMQNAAGEDGGNAAASAPRTASPPSKDGSPVRPSTKNTTNISLRRRAGLQTFTKANLANRAPSVLGGGVGLGSGGAGGVMQRGPESASGADITEGPRFVHRRIRDLKNGSYSVAYTPRVAGRYMIHVRINGLPIQGSPFELEVRSTVFLPLTFLYMTEDIKLSEDAMTVTNSVQGWRSVIAGHNLPFDRPSSWRVHIEKLNAVWLGIIGHSNPTPYSWQEPTAFGWFTNNYVYSGGAHDEGKNGWIGFEAGDDIVFKYDPPNRKLTMRLDRLPMETYTIDIPRDFDRDHRSANQFHALVSLSSSKDVVQLAHPGTPTMPILSRAHGPGLTKAKRDVAAGFIVVAHNADDIQQPQCNDEVKFQVVGDGVVPGTYPRKGDLVDCVLVKSGVGAEEGSYRCHFTPRFEGQALVHVQVNGGAVLNSPFTLKVEPTMFVPLRFMTVSGMGIELSPDKLMVVGSDVSGQRYAIAGHSLPKNQICNWRIKIHSLRGQNSLLGVIANQRPMRFPWQDPTAFGWFASEPNVIVGGSSQPHLGNWNGFEDGDVVVFMNDPISETLTMMVSRLPMESFTIHTGPVPFRVLATLGEGDKLELIDPETPTVAAKCVIVEDAGLEESEALVTAGFSLRAHNKYGIMQPSGGDIITFRFTPNNVDSEESEDESFDEDHRRAFEKLAKITLADDGTDDTCGGKFKNLGVTDIGNGLYQMQYLPISPGEYNLHVMVNGEPLEESPFELDVAETFFAPLRFEEPRIPIAGLLLSDDNRIVSNSHSSPQCVVARHPLPQNRTSWWAVTITKLPLNSAGLLGIIANYDKLEKENEKKMVQQAGSYGWAANAGVLVRGTTTSGLNGWEGFEEGDQVVFKYDPRADKLTMKVARLPMRSYTLDTDPSVRMGAFQPFFRLCLDDRIEIGDVPSNTIPLDSYADGPGLVEAEQGVITGFMVHTKNHQGFTQPFGGEEVTFKLVKRNADVDGLWKSVRDESNEKYIVDNRDGSYSCSYDTYSEGNMNLHVLVNAEEIDGSPFSVSVMKTFCVPLRFERPYEQKVFLDGSECTILNASDEGRFVVARHRVPVDFRYMSMLWRIKIHQLRSGGIGVMCKEVNERYYSWTNISASGWCSKTKSGISSVFSGGTEQLGAGGWAGFEDGDDAVFSYHSKTESLTMRISRLPMNTYTLPIGRLAPGKELVVVANIGSEDKLELVDFAVPTLATKCKARGVGLVSAEQYLPTGFIVEVGNEDGFLQPFGNESVECSINIQGESTELKASKAAESIQIYDRLNGSYLCSYVPLAASNIEINIKVNGKLIPNCPFVAAVTPVTFKPLRFISPMPEPKKIVSTPIPTSPSSPIIQKARSEESIPFQSSNKAAKVTEDGICTQSFTDGQEESYAVAWHELPSDRSVHWRLKINHVKNGAVGIMVSSDALEITGIKPPQNGRREDFRSRKQRTQLSVGTRVTARYAGREKWFPGEITRVNEESGTYNIKYDDGDNELGVHREAILIEPRFYGWGVKADDTEDDLSAVGTITVAGSTEDCDAYEVSDLGTTSSGTLNAKWKGFNDGDEITLKYAPLTGKLFMKVARLPLETFSLTVGTPSIGERQRYCAIVKMMGEGNEVRILNPEVPTAPKLCMLDGPGIDSGDNGIVAGFQLRTFNEDGHAQTFGGDHIQIDLSPAPDDEPAVATIFDPSRPESTHGANHHSPYFDNVSVIDDDSGLYRCSYAPKVDGAVELRVRINGAHVSGSPFKLTVKPTLFTKLRYMQISELDGVFVNKDLRIVRCSQNNRFAVAGHALPADRPAWWSMKFHRFSEGMVGIIGNPHPNEVENAMPWTDRTVFGWCAKSGQTIVGGREHASYDAWKCFKEGDEAMFCLHPKRQSLTMRISRLPMQTFRISTGPIAKDEAFSVLLHLNEGDKIELLDPAMDTDSSQCLANGPGLKAVDKNISTGFVVTAYNEAGFVQPKGGDCVTFCVVRKEESIAFHDEMQRRRNTKIELHRMKLEQELSMNGMKSIVEEQNSSKQTNTDAASAAVNVNLSKQSHVDIEGPTQIVDNSSDDMDESDSHGYLDDDDAWKLATDAAVATSLHVHDNGDGTYLCSYVAHVADCGLEIHVCINEEAINNSPFQVNTNVTMMAPLRFVTTSGAGVKVDDTQRQAWSIAPDQQFAIAGHDLPNNRPSWWRIKIHKVIHTPGSDLLDGAGSTTGKSLVDGGQSIAGISLADGSLSVNSSWEDQFVIGLVALPQDTVVGAVDNQANDGQSSFNVHDEDHMMGSSFHWHNSFGWTASPGVLVIGGREASGAAGDETWVGFCDGDEAVLHYDPSAGKISLKLYHLVLQEFTLETGLFDRRHEVRPFVALRNDDKVELVDPMVPTSALHSDIDGPGLQNAEQHITTGFMLRTYNAEAFCQPFGGDTIAVSSGMNMSSTSHRSASSVTAVNTHVEVRDMHDGCYLVTYTPVIAGELRIDVNINGEPVDGSPFTVSVDPTVFVPLHFTHSSEDVVTISPDQTVACWKVDGNHSSFTAAGDSNKSQDNTGVKLSLTASRDGLKTSRSNSFRGSNKRGYALTSHPLPRDRKCWWRMRVNKLGRESMLGIIANDHPYRVAWMDPSSFGWFAAEGTQVVAGREMKKAGWKGLQTGDEIVFRYDPRNSVLTANVVRLPMVSFNIDTSMDSIGHGDTTSQPSTASSNAVVVTRFMACLGLGDSVELMNQMVPTAAHLCVATGPGLEKAEQKVISGFQLHTYNMDSFPQSRGGDDVVFYVAKIPTEAEIDAAAAEERQRAAKRYRGIKIEVIEAKDLRMTGSRRSSNPYVSITLDNSSPDTTRKVEPQRKKKEKLVTRDVRTATKTNGGKNPPPFNEVLQIDVPEGIYGHEDIIVSVVDEDSPNIIIGKVTIKTSDLLKTTQGEEMDSTSIGSSLHPESTLEDEFIILHNEFPAGDVHMRLCLVLDDQLVDKKDEDTDCIILGSAVGEDEFMKGTNVLDNGDGSYFCTYEPKVSGIFHMHVLINGTEVKASPFLINIAPTTWSPLRFCFSSDEGITVNDDYTIATNSDPKGELRWAITRHELPKDRVVWWRMRVNNLGDGCLCVTKISSMTEGPKNREKPWQEASAFGWCAQKGGIVVEGGREQIEAAIWSGFGEDDELVFKHDPTLQIITMKSTRMPMRSFTLSKVSKAAFAKSAKAIAASQANAEKEGIQAVEDVICVLTVLGHGGSVELLDTEMPSDPARVISVGTGLKEGKRAVPSGFKLTTFCNHGMQQPIGGDVISVELQLNNKRSGRLRDGEEQETIVTAVQIFDNNDGTYNIAYTPQIYGQDVKLHVYLNDEPIAGSPFNIRILPSRWAPLRFLKAGGGTTLLNEGRSVSFNEPVLAKGAKTSKNLTASSYAIAGYPLSSDKSSSWTFRVYRQNYISDRTEAPNDDTVFGIVRGSDPIVMGDQMAWADKTVFGWCGARNKMVVMGEMVTMQTESAGGDGMEFEWDGLVDGDVLFVTYEPVANCLSMKIARLPMAHFSIDMATYVVEKVDEEQLISPFFHLSKGDRIELVDPMVSTMGRLCLVQQLQQSIDRDFLYSFKVKTFNRDGFPLPFGGEKVEINLEYEDTFIDVGEYKSENMIQGVSLDAKKSISLESNKETARIESNAPGSMASPDAPETAEKESCETASAISATLPQPSISHSQFDDQVHTATLELCVLEAKNLREMLATEEFRVTAQLGNYVRQTSLMKGDGKILLAFNEILEKIPLTFDEQNGAQDENFYVSVVSNDGTIIGKSAAFAIDDLFGLPSHAMDRSMTLKLNEKYAGEVSLKMSVKLGNENMSIMSDTTTPGDYIASKKDDAETSVAALDRKINCRDDLDNTSIILKHNTGSEMLNRHEKSLKNVDIVDLGDGSYHIQYMALVEKSVKLNVRVNGEATNGSPYPLSVAHTSFLPLQFMTLSADGIHLENEGKEVRSTTNDNPRFAIAGHPITTQDYPVWWKLKIKSAGNVNRYKCGFWLGIVANTALSFDSYEDQTATMWCSEKGRVIVDGKEQKDSDWCGFEDDDEVTFKLEAISRTLSMNISRFPLRWFSLTPSLSPAAEVFPHVSLVSKDSAVEIIDPRLVPAAPELCVTKGEVFSFAQKDVPGTFTVTVYNADGHLVPSAVHDRLEMRVTCDETQAREAGRDKDNAAYPMHVGEDDYGTFSCSFTPQVSGPVQLHLILNGIPIAGSPFHLDVKPSVYVPLRFVSQSDDSVKLDASRIKATNESDDVFEYEDVTAGGPLPNDRPAWWKMRIDNLQEGLIGLIGDSEPPNKGYSWQGPTAYMFETSQSGGRLVMQGRQCEDIDNGWAGFIEGDEPIFKYDPRSERLSVELPRLPGKHFTIKTGPPPPNGFMVHCSFQAGDSVALVPLEVPTLPRKCFASMKGPGRLRAQSIIDAQVTKFLNFTVQAVNFDGFPQPFGNDKVDFTMKESIRVLGEDGMPAMRRGGEHIGNEKSGGKAEMGFQDGANEDKDDETFEDNPIVAANIDDIGDGTYQCSFSPISAGYFDLSVLVNGSDVEGSPFFVNVAPPPLTFDTISSNGIALNEYRTEISQEGISQYRFGMCSPSLPQDRVSEWKFTIHEWGSGAFFGVIGGDHTPDNKAHKDKNAFMWMDNDKVILGGQERRFMDGWKGFALGDVLIFRYDPLDESLFIQVHRLKQTQQTVENAKQVSTFSLPIGTPLHGSFRAVVVLKCFSGKTRIEVSEVQPNEWNRLAEISQSKRNKAKDITQGANVKVIAARPKGSGYR